jgi:hypothetical protein
VRMLAIDEWLTFPAFSGLEVMDTLLLRQTICRGKPSP